MAKKKANTGADTKAGKKKPEGTDQDTTLPTLGFLGRIVAETSPNKNYLLKPTSPVPSEPHSTTKESPTPPDTFFTDDQRMGWLPGYIIGDTERVVSRVNIFLKGNQLPIDFTVDDVLALARRGGRGMTQAWFTPKAIVESVQGKRVKKRSKSTDCPGKKPGPSKDVQKLRSKLYNARKKAGAKTGKYRDECWETWIHKFKHQLSPQSLLDVDVKLQHPYTNAVKARNLDVGQWKRLYWQEREARKAQKRKEGVEN